MTYDATDQGKVGRRQRRVEARQAMDAADLRALLGLPAGRRFLARLLRAARVGEPLFVANAMELAARAGVRDWCRWLVDELERCDPGVQAALARELAPPLEDEDE